MDELSLSVRQETRDLAPLQILICWVPIFKFLPSASFPPVGCGVVKFYCTIYFCHQNPNNPASQGPGCLFFLFFFLSLFRNTLQVDMKFCSQLHPSLFTVPPPPNFHLETQAGGREGGRW